MNRVLVYAVGLLVVVAPCLAQTGAPPAERVRPAPVEPDPAADASLRALFDDFAKAWNAADAKALADLFEPASGRVRSFTESFEGTARVRDWFDSALSGRLRDSRFRVVSVRTFRDPRSHVAVVFELTPAGSPTLTGELDAAVVVVDGNWRLRRLWAQEFDHPNRSRVAHIGGGLREPRKLLNVPAVYPVAAKQARVQGVVILECVIGPDGKMLEVNVLRGMPMLDEAAVEAVSQWEYEPSVVDGEPVPVIMTVTVNFRLS